MSLFFASHVFAAFFILVFYPLLFLFPGVSYQSLSPPISPFIPMTYISIQSMVPHTPLVTSDAISCHFATKAVHMHRTSSHFSLIPYRPHVPPVLSHVTHFFPFSKRRQGAPSSRPAPLRGGLAWPNLCQPGVRRGRGKIRRGVLCWRQGDSGSSTLRVECRVLQRRRCDCEWTEKGFRARRRLTPVLGLVCWECLRGIATPCATIDRNVAKAGIRSVMPS
jgi:hypothetical protein